MHRYSAFNMDIRSEIILSLPKWRDDRSESEPFIAVNVKLGRVESMEGLKFALGKIRYGHCDGVIQIEVPWAGRYRIDKNFTVTVDPEHGAPEQMTAIYISAFILTFILNCAGAITLHGSAIAVQGKAALFCGCRGAGKSTTAAALARKGYSVLCDDIIPVIGGSLVLPGIPFPKLLPDAYERLVGDPEQAEHLFDGIDKYQVDLGAIKKPMPVKAVFVIELSDNKKITVEPVRGMEKVRLLITHQTAPGGLLSYADQFRKATERLGSADMFRIRRPSGSDTLESAVEIIEKIIREPA